MEPRRGRKTLIRNIFLSPLQGSAPLSDPTPGLRPGLFSFRPAGALVGWSELHSRKYRVSTWLRQAPGFRFPDSLLRAGGIYVLQLLRCSESS
jgi:hypothetical protein